MLFLTPLCSNQAKNSAFLRSLTKMAKVNLIAPPFLKPGDSIGIVAPARKISADELNPAIRQLESWGLKVKLGKHIYAASHQFAGTDEERVADMQQMLDDKEVKAIIAARGGYGSVRIIDKLDFTKFCQNPKWMAGFSDITVFHSHIQMHFGIETLHSTMPFNFGKDVESTELLKNALYGELKEYRTEGHPLNRKGKNTGILCGGNLSLLYALAGTPSDIDTAGKILFLEDLDEYLYHIDRMMMQLKRSGKLAHLTGLIIGGFSEMKDNIIPFGEIAEQIIIEAVGEYKYPVCFGFPVGHGLKNFPLYMGRNVELAVDDKNATLKFTL
jgi:muramoyltetrapeptide carboxypeptidase